MDWIKDSVFNYDFEFETDIINLRSYFDDYKKLVEPFVTDVCDNERCKTETKGCGTDTCKNDQFYRDFMGISQKELEELKERTSVDHLTCDGEIEPILHKFYMKFDENNIKPKQSNEKDTKEIKCDLVSVMKRRELLDLTKNEFGREYFKYCNYQWCPPPSRISLNPQLKSRLDPFKFSNIVACVKVYYPFVSYQTKPVKAKLLQEIHILGHQMLCDLKDKITCSLDHSGCTDVSDEVFLEEVGALRIPKHEYPSSFIFIENVFYNDTRFPKSLDLSRVIREWGSKRGLGPFETKSMENTRICDLKLKIGHPYVYQHQANCEHIIIFSDIRFLGKNDSYKPSHYPKTHCTGRIYGRHCMMCSDAYARWLVVGSTRLTHDKAYLCNKCFISYNYVDGKKIGEFQAYKYVDPVALL